ncbi:hypothetical protein TNCV_3789571 [Trichonephila clavipes]|nr:hypothetical protein TNCV_3789571 [Trichonephila clavipes]
MMQKFSSVSCAFSDIPINLCNWFCENSALSGTAASHHPPEGRERRTPLFHQPTPPHASGGTTQRSSRNPRLQAAGQRPGHGPQHPLLPRPRQNCDSLEVTDLDCKLDVPTFYGTSKFFLILQALMAVSRDVCSLPQLWALDRQNPRLLTT